MTTEAQPFSPEHILRMAGYGYRTYNDETEEWRDVVDYEGWYEVSSLGRVRSLPRIVTKLHPTTRCVVEHSIRGCILRPQITHKKQGLRYMHVALCRDGDRRKFSIHRIVATAFLPNPENKASVNHLNGVQDDNRVVNLEWATPAENVQHAVDVLGAHRGARSGGAKLTEDCVVRMRQDYDMGDLSHAALAKRYGVARSTVTAAISGRNWRHVA